MGPGGQAHWKLLVLWALLQLLIPGAAQLHVSERHPPPPLLRRPGRPLPAAPPKYLSIEGTVLLSQRPGEPELQIQAAQAAAQQWGRRVTQQWAAAAGRTGSIPLPAATITSVAAVAGTQRAGAAKPAAGSSARPATAATATARAPTASESQAPPAAAPQAPIAQPPAALAPAASAEPPSTALSQAASQAKAQPATPSLAQTMAPAAALAPAASTPPPSAAISQAASPAKA
ncbi:hypothetical protein ABPG77_006081 [Micractinium sp. CCAP 211/92]